jgi:thiopurine S-methyltransferase
MNNPSNPVDRSFWQERWDQGRTGFHEGRPNDQLVAHVERIAPAPGKRILVPLAGKAVDVWWLVDRGHEVVGIEIVQRAIDQLFEGRGLDANAHHIELGRDPAFRAQGLTMICGDVFDTKPEVLGTFDAVYDRAALVAIDPPLRARYVETCRALCKPGAPTLLVSLAYDQSKAPGPPFSVAEADVRTLFAPRVVERLGRRDVPAPPNFAQRGVPTFEESAYLVAG